MRKVDQSRFGFPHGNCFAACVASLLGISIEELPDLNACTGDWTRPLNRWLAQYGLAYVEMCTETNAFYTRLPRGLHAILGGLSPRHTKTPEGQSIHHAVIGCADGKWAFEIVHDPHPSRDGLDGPVESVGFILPLMPASVSSCLRGERALDGEA
jgi:hypothetical protein